MGTPNNNRLPEEIYVRRRIAALVVIIVVVVLLIWGLVALAGGNGEDETEPDTQSTQAADTQTSTEETESAAEESTSATETTETTEAKESTETTTATESADPTESTTSSTEGAKQSCALSDLQVRVDSDRPNYGSSAEPTFYLTVENPTAVDCEVDLSENVMRFEVYDLATNQRVWSDVDCNAPVGDGDETFEAGSERNFQAVWSRTTSSPDTCSNRQSVPAGAYFVHGVIGGNASNSHTFNLG